MREGSVPEEWKTGLIVLIWKGKGHVQDLRKYRGITLLSRFMKVLERILGGKIRKSVEMDIREQKGFIKGKGMTDGMFTPRQLEERGWRCKIRLHWDLWIWRRPTTLS